MKITGCLTLILLLVTCNTIAGQTDLRHFQDGVRYSYRLKLLELALLKGTPSGESFRLIPEFTSVTQSIGLDLLEKGSIDVVFLATNKTREQRFLPIKIPIMRGILGYRVFLIHKDNVNQFSSVSSLHELKQLIAGFGSEWGDMAILRHNQMPVDGYPQYESLFEMLSIKRFDYFPRGINEAWAEIKSKGQAYPDLRVEKSLGLYYPFPTYFFVNKKNTALAKRIESGLKIALADGSFKHLFFLYHREIIHKAHLQDRKVFTLTNPTIPETTPEVDTSWWLQ